ncbi:MAG: magnesium transporter, partial [Dietzia sp.]|nr:magnesium transporter [Dietzia sp.]
MGRSPLAVPTPPKGVEIADYPTYLEAQKAVDYLSDHQFPVQLVTIVGVDLKMVERVTGRLSYPRVALAGAASGAWFGLFVGLLLSLFSPGTTLFET